MSLLQRGKLSRAVSSIKEKHAPIAALFEQGVGYHLMRIESDLLIKILARLRAENIVALPLHGSILVAKTFAARAKTLMDFRYRHKEGLSTLMLAAAQFPYASSKGSGPKGKSPPRPYSTMLLEWVR